MEYEQNNTDPPPVASDMEALDEQDMGEVDPVGPPEDMGQPAGDEDMDDAGPEDMEPGDGEDMDTELPNLGDPAPPGPPPELDPAHPLRDLKPVERVLSGDLTKSIEHLQWLPEPSQLWFSVCKGNGSSVEKLDAAAYEADPSRQEHPYSMFTYQEFTEGDRAWESMRLPAHFNGRGETHWCRRALSVDEMWCHHNVKKSSEHVIRVASGDGVTAPVEYTSWKLPGGSHSGLYVYTETSDGKLYFVYKKGIINARSYITLIDTATLVDPEPGSRGSDPMTRVTAESVPNDVYGIAISPDEKTLYFTTGGYHTDGGFGALWSAPIMADGTLGAQTILVGDVPRARGMTVDSAGNLYVASETNVLVFNAQGQSLGVIDAVSDATHKEALLGGKKRFTALSVAFGGPYFNVLYVGFGYDRKGTENIGEGTHHTLGGLYRVPLQAQGAWAQRFGIMPPAP